MIVNDHPEECFAFSASVFIGKTKNKHTNGGVAQLGEHLPCKQGVMGSNPIISTRHFSEWKNARVKEAKHTTTWAYSSAG